MLNETRWTRLIYSLSQWLGLYGKMGFKQSIHNNLYAVALCSISIWSL